ncbi:exported hypothetical protein [Pseudomonas sp. IT-P218]
MRMWRRCFSDVAVATALPLSLASQLLQWPAVLTKAVSTAKPCRSWLASDGVSPATATFGDCHNLSHLGYARRSS